MDGPSEAKEPERIMRYSLEFLYDFGEKHEKTNQESYLRLMKLKILSHNLDLKRLRHVKLSSRFTTQNFDELHQNYFLDEFLIRTAEQYAARKSMEAPLTSDESSTHMDKKVDEPVLKMPTVEEIEREFFKSEANPERKDFDTLRHKVLDKANAIKERIHFLHNVWLRHHPPNKIDKQPMQPQKMHQPPPQMAPPPLNYNHNQFPPPQRIAQGPQTLPRFPFGMPPPQYNAQPVMPPQYQQVPQLPFVRPNGAYHPQIPTYPVTVPMARPVQALLPNQQRRVSEDVVVPISKDQLKLKGKVLADDQILLFSLLSLTPGQRDEFIVKEAKKRGILRRRVLPPTFDGPTLLDGNTLNTKFRPLVPAVQRYALDRIASRKQRNSMSQASDDDIKTEDTDCDSKKSVPVVKNIIKKDKDKLSYEEQIVMLVNDVDDLSDMQKIKYWFNVSESKLKLMCDNKRTALVQEFVEKLVADKKGHLHISDVRVHSKHYAKAFVSDIEARDVYISNPILRRNALHGDIVEVYVHHAIEIDPVQSDTDVDDAKPNKLGFVTRIIEKRHNRQCVGTFEPFKKENQTSGQINFLPRDPRMPIIKIPKKHWPDALLKKDVKNIENVLYQAEILQWKKHKPIGSIIKSYGACGELVAETAAILGDLNVIPYPKEILEQYQSMKATISEKEVEYREDLRKSCIFTVDPATARDLDDAVSARQLENGNYEIGVHIADVSSFFPENSFTESIVKEKATTIYMVDQAYHMLPQPLTMLCSLLPGEDKLAFSVFWEFTSDGNAIVSTRFSRTVINSCAQLSYEHCQVIVDNPDADCAADFPKICGDHTFDDLRKATMILHKISRILRAKRFANGAIKIDKPKLWFNLDPVTGFPSKYGICELKESNQLIEEFMLLANISVAEFIYKKYPQQSILRQHNKPNENALDTLESTLKKFKYNLEGRNSLKLRDSMEKLVAKAEYPNAMRAVLQVMLSKPMQRAKYFCSSVAKDARDLYHFGLAIPIYTHFTSPIRRYADILVHRTLSAALGYTPVSARDTNELQLLANKCNEQKWSAKVAGDKCSELYFMHYIKSVGKLTMRAGVFAIGTNSMEVVLIDTDECVKIFYKNLKIQATPSEDKLGVVVMFPDRPPFNVTLFTELVVELEVQKSKFVINSILPPD